MRQLQFTPVDQGYKANPLLGTLFSQGWFRVKTTNKKQASAEKQNIDSLIREHSDFVMSFISKRTWDKQVTEDIFQSTMLEAVRSYKNFRGDSHPRTWLCGIAFNMIRVHAKSIKNQATEPVEAIEQNQSSTGNQEFGTEDPLAIYERNDCFDQIRRVFDGLPTDMRETFNQVVNLGKSYEETAQDLSVPIGTVRSRVARSREILRSRLFQEDNLF